VSFSHLGLTAPCSSCHNGINAIGKQIRHVSTTHDCGTCHNTVNWTVTVQPPPRRPGVPGVRGVPGVATPGTATPGGSSK
jgi:hypothetical protein